MTQTADHPHFILFAHARSGSSNLLKTLQLHPGLRISEEPFHPLYSQWNADEPNYASLIRDIPSLESCLSPLFSKYRGIKILDYQLPEDVYAHLLLKPELKIISLLRRNCLQAVVSGFVAEQTGVWKKWDATPDTARRYKEMAPIDLQELESRLSYMKELRRFYSGVLARKPKQRHMALIYEDLYTDDFEVQREIIARIYTFLDLDMGPVDKDRLRYYLTPKDSKINSRETYALIPNVDEINRTFGCEETGFLF